MHHQHAGLGPFQLAPGEDIDPLVALILQGVYKPLPLDAGHVEDIQLGDDGLQTGDLGEPHIVLTHEDPHIFGNGQIPGRDEEKLDIPELGHGLDEGVYRASVLQVAAQAESQRDSLALVVSAKDSLINGIFSDINAISENLAQIKSRENLISVSGQEDGVRRPIQEINNDIAAIDRLLQENREKIASLQRTSALLRKANQRIEGLDKMISDLNGQLAEKTGEIERLRGELAQMGLEVKTLTETVAERSAEVETLSGEKTELENQLNTVYYIVGAEKELRDAQIINKQGFIGRTLTANQKSRLDSFTQADARLLTEVPVGQKRVTVVTTHPEDSYRLEGDGKVVSRLVITDPARFWESSKVLIVSYK